MSLQISQSTKNTKKEISNQGVRSAREVIIIANITTTAAAASTAAAAPWSIRGGHTAAAAAATAAIETGTGTAANGATAAADTTIGILPWFFGLFLSFHGLFTKIFIIETLEIIGRETWI